MMLKGNFKPTGPRAIALMVLFAWTSAVFPVDFGEQVWDETDLSESLDDAAQRGLDLRLPRRYHAVKLSAEALRQILSSAPHESSGERGLPVDLPMPDGSFREFLVEVSPVMAPGLAERYPEISTYRVVASDDAATTGRLDLTPQGFHAMITGPGETVMIDPVTIGRAIEHISFARQDAVPPDSPWQCLVEDHHQRPEVDAMLAAQEAGNQVQAATLPSGAELRTYRAAIAATAEYTTFHGGTKALGQAAIVTAVNRLNQLFNLELAIHLVLVANNDDIVFTNPGTDPFTNNNTRTMLDQVQPAIDDAIGDENYDIGHVFSTAGGGVAYLSTPCTSNWKARGVSGISQPTGDNFYIDMVAHEMGHQFGSHHTFNGSTGNCAAPNRSPASAFEPASGSTIMAYSGICGSENLQIFADQNYHTHSFQRIINYTTLFNGNSCPVVSNTGNTVPIPDAGPDYTIPIGTPFMLTGSAVDPDSDVLTYSWEQYDLGDAGPPNTDDGFRPIFRSFPPVTSPTRLFPRLSDLLSNTSTLGESLPTTDRTLTFRLTVRDNALGGGGVDFDTVELTTTTAAGPFAITSQNTAEEWLPGEIEFVTWNVAGTAGAPVNCAEVEIDFSPNGGASFPISLGSGIINDGQKSVTVPDIATVAGRVRVKCSDNIFFDINNATITVPGAGQVTTCSNPDLAIPDDSESGVVDTMVLSDGGSIADIAVSLDVSHSWVGDVAAVLANLDTGTARLLIDRPGVPASQFGCSGDDIDILLLDNAARDVESLCGNSPALGGVARPQQALSAFVGQDRAATWLLQVFDLDAGQSGTLNGWCITTNVAAQVADSDGDGVNDDVDNCPDDVNPLQEDYDGDGSGYVCDSTCAPAMDFLHTFANGDAFDLLASGTISFGGSVMNGATVLFDATQGVSFKPSTSFRNGAVVSVATTGCTP